MLIKTTLYREDLEEIAAARGQRFEESSTTERPRRGGRDIRGRFVPGEDRDRYKRVSANYAFGNSERRVAALCFHGFLDLFRDIFERDPDAKIQTAFETWDSLEDLNRRAVNAYSKMVGSEMYPIRFGELCRCEWEGQLDTQH